MIVNKTKCDRTFTNSGLPYRDNCRKKRRDDDRRGTNRERLAMVILVRSSFFKPLTSFKFSVRTLCPLSADAERALIYDYYFHFIDHWNRPLRTEQKQLENWKKGEETSKNKNSKFSQTQDMCTS